MNFQPPVNTAVCIISGGMDSTVLLHFLRHKHPRVFALSINYGQRHAKELECAKWQCEQLGVEHHIVDLADALNPLLQGSSLTSKDIAVPEGHYAADNMKATVVPNRNMIMLAIAAGYGISRTPDREGLYLAYGAHAGDHDIYPDCRQDFTAALGRALALCDWKTVMLYTPFVQKTKADIAKLGYDMGVDFAHTWTCYKGGEKACGRCGTCVERLEAFAKVGLEDPLEYEDREYWKTVTTQA